MAAADVLDCFGRPWPTMMPTPCETASSECSDWLRVFGLSAEEEYLVRHPDYVMEMPQSQERIRGREAMRSMQETFPVPPKVTLRRVLGSGRVWVIEGLNGYDGDVWNIALIWELDDEAADRAGHALLRTEVRTARLAVPVGRATRLSSELGRCFG